MEINRKVSALKVENRKETIKTAVINIAGQIKIIKTVPAEQIPARQQNKIDET
jgi:hypothetical protein